MIMEAISTRDRGGRGGGAKEVEVGIEEYIEGGKERKRMEGDESGGRRG